MKQNIYPGKLIVAEGLDGSGKTTCFNLLRNWLEIKGYGVEVLKRKQSKLVAETINQAKLDHTLVPITYSLIHAADFSDLMHRQVIPALKAGFVVLFNKYVYTSIAKDYLRGQNKDWVQMLYDFAIKPDLVFYFKLPLEMALERLTQEEKEKDYYDSGMDIGFGPNHVQSLRNFQTKLGEQYDLLARMNQFTTIDASKPIQQQLTQMKRVIETLLDT